MSCLENVDITNKVSAKIVINPSHLGMVFAGMGSDQQADFWLGVAAATSSWEKDAGFQWAMMVEDLKLNPVAHSAFKKISEYGVE